jgi:hypothetical protein
MSFWNVISIYIFIFFGRGGKRRRGRREKRQEGRGEKND